jgi:hypothetical protein
MNKKFFTLIAGAFMLAASLGTANAAVEVSGTGGAAAKLPYGNSGNLYQLLVNTGGGADSLKLVVDKNGLLYALKIDVPFSNFGESLWCINIEKESQGANPKFDFTNKSTGHLLAVNAADTLAALADTINLNYGVYSGWGFSRTYEDKLQIKQPFSTYYTADSVYVLALKDSVGGIARVGIKAFGADKLDPNEPNNVYTDNDVLLFTVYEPAQLILSASEFNTKLNTLEAANVKLTFDKDRNNTSLKNPWSDFALRASASPQGVEWMRFQKDIANDKTFLRVDTSYTGSYSNHLNFAFDSVALEIENQYEFQVRYDVSTDSISIRAYAARFNFENNAIWANAYETTNADSLHVKLYDLVKEDQVRIITIGPEPVNTKAEFGIGDCGDPVTTNLTSLENNLYVIKKGELTLIVPIYTDTVGPKWVKLDDAVVGGTVDPKYIPAYQWAVVQTRKDQPEISPIYIQNREFPNIHFPLTGVSIQLKKDADVMLFGTGVRATDFKEVPPEQKKDSLLGYKYLTNDDSRFNTYVFNYLHKYNDEEFLNVKKIGTDTSLFVDVEKTQFELIRHYGGDAYYGYYSTDIKGLSPLKKVAYTIKVKDQSKNTNKYVLVNREENRYVIGGTLGAGDTAVFLLKTNNTRVIDGVVKHYYALVDTGSYFPDVVKVGIEDATVWAYVLEQKEVRTSAFAALEWTEPLYRRFDGETYGSREIKEIFGTKANEPQLLQFATQSNWGTNFLFENSPRGAGSPDPNKPNTNDFRDDLTPWGQANISFLGLYNKIQYPPNGEKSNYTFYVDTAFVKRKSNGGATTDYREYTAKPQYMLAVRPEFSTGDTIWTFSKDSTWDSKGGHWVHPSETTMVVQPSFTRGFYVFNAQDSIGSNNLNPRKPDYVGKATATYSAPYTTRLAFVDGIHKGDTFYVIRDHLADSKYKDQNGKV